MQIVPRLSLSVFYAFFLGGEKARRSRGSSDKICIISIENVVAARHSEGSGAPKIYSFDGDTRQVFSPEVWEDLRLWQTRCLVAHVPSFSSGLSKCVGCVCVAPEWSCH